MPRRFDAEIGQRMLAYIDRELGGVERDPAHACEHYRSALKMSKALVKYGWFEKEDLEPFLEEAEFAVMGEITRMHRR